MNLSLDEQYWTSRYLQNQIGWDVGHATFPIKQFLDQIDNKEIRILIPGAGNAYEAAYAFDLGFKNTHILDFSKYPLDKFQGNYPNFPSNQIHHEDFFNHEGEYDLVLEQTFFCALEIDLRPAYVKKMYQLLNGEGVLAGVLFDRVFDHDGPPFGGTKKEYENLFSEFFHIKTLEPCFNSIPPRKDSEVFMILKKIL